MGVAADSEACEERWGLPARVLLGGLLLLGALLRALAASRSYWIDEAWVLNSAQAASLREMFFFPEWIQTTPPGLLLLLRSLLVTGEVPVENLRWLPIVCSMLTLLVFARLAGATLRPGYALVAVAMFALSPQVLWYSTELKQYSVDMLWAAISLWVGVRYLKRPRRGLMLAWFGAFVPVATLSHSALFSLPPMILAGLLWGEGRWQGRARLVLPAAASGGAVVVAVQAIFIRPNTAAFNLAAFWQDGFYSSSGFSLAYFLRRTLGVLLEFLNPVDLSPAATLGAMLVLACGVVGLARRAPPPLARRMALLALFVLPVLGVLGANVVGAYPLSEFRLVCCLTPALVMLLAHAAQWAGEMLLPAASARSRDVLHQRIGLVLACVTVLWMAPRASALPRLGAGWDLQFLMDGKMDLRWVVDYLRATDGPERTVYVMREFEQALRLYTRAAPLRARLVMGQTSWPCCVPTHPWRGYEVRREEVDADVDALRAAVDRRDFLLVVPWRVTSSARDASEQFRASLEAHGCAVTWAVRQRRVTLMRAQCDRAGADASAAMPNVSHRVGDGLG